MNLLHGNRAVVASIVRLLALLISNWIQLVSTHGNPQRERCSALASLRCASQLAGTALRRGEATCNAHATEMLEERQ
jgi:hypothetical protein